MPRVLLFQDSHFLADAHTTSAYVPMSSLLGYPQSHAPDAETPSRLWSGQPWDEGALLQTGMDGKAIQVEKIQQQTGTPRRRRLQIDGLWINKKVINQIPH